MRIPVDRNPPLRFHPSMFNKPIKNYYVLIKGRKTLTFPPICPFTGEPMPSAWVTLKQIGNVRYSPLWLLLGLLKNNYNKASLKVKASQGFANLYRKVQAMKWISLLGGIGVTVIFLELNSKSPNPSMIPFLVIFVAVLGSAAFKTYGYILIKNCHISSVTNEHIEVCFASEDYASSFCKLNGLEYEARR